MHEADHATPNRHNEQAATPELLAPEPSYPRYNLRLARYRGLAEAIVAYGRDHRGEDRGKLRILDVGVGRGRTYRYIERMDETASFDFYGVDICPKRLAKVYDAEHWNLHRVDVEDGLPFRDASFDIVVCEQVLEHVPRPEFVVGEICRVAFPGALILLGVPSFPPGLAAIRRHVIPRIDTLRGIRRSHVQCYSLTSFVRMLESSAAVSIQEVRGFRFVTGGPLRWLEDQRWWYRLNRWMGARVPSCATEIQVLAKRNGNAVQAR